MKINGNAIRPGNIIDHKGRLWRATKIQHTQPGKGGAYAQVELKDIRDGTKLNERFRSSESVECVRLDEKEYQYLFNDGATYTFMDQESFDQINVPAPLVEDVAHYLQDGMVVKMCSYEGEVIQVQVPATVVMTIVEAEPVVKGQTAASSFKPAKLDNGERIMVPPYIELGTRVVVNTEDGSYVERAKE